LPSRIQLPGNAARRQLNLGAGPGLFSPRDLATLLRALLADGIPDIPVLLGL